MSGSVLRYWPPKHRKRIKRELYVRDGGKCQICLIGVEWDDVSFDHIVPVSQGGRNGRENLRLAHTWCNEKRGGGIMPYVKEDRIKELEKGDYARSPGELNYSITVLALDYIENNVEEINYETLNAIIGAIESAKLEFYRRVTSQYEEIKIRENGDVYRSHAAGRLLV